MVKGSHGAADRSRGARGRCLNWDFSAPWCRIGTTFGFPPIYALRCASPLLVSARPRASPLAISLLGSLHMTLAWRSRAWQVGCTFLLCMPVSGRDGAYLVI